jgi:hypothetical protein
VAASRSSTGSSAASTIMLAPKGSPILAAISKHASSRPVPRNWPASSTPPSRWSAAYLDTAGLTPSPRRVTAARRQRSTTDQQLTTRAAELGFASLLDYLADRAMTRRWPSTSIADELGVHPATVRDRLDQHGLPRQRATVRPHRAIQRQRVCWAAKRQVRLAKLGFADLEAYLRVRRVQQGSSLRRMLTELRVGSA